MLAKANIDPGLNKEEMLADPTEKRERLVDYHTNVLASLLKKLAAMRVAECIPSSHVCAEVEVDNPLPVGGHARLSATKTYVEDAMEGIIFPSSTNAATATAASSLARATSVDTLILNQLGELVSRIAGLYRDDLAFHTFEHASHVVQFVTKLTTAMETTNPDNKAHQLLNRTKSMIAHPLTRFVLIYVALVCDAGGEITQNTKPIAAEKSIQRAWSLFCEPAFRDLRRYICRSRRDLVFFRRLLSKGVMAMTMKGEAVDAHSTTTIEQRHEASAVNFSALEDKSAPVEDVTASQSAITIIEQLLRVSSVPHALQCFSIFTKWNRLLFEELYVTTDNNDESKKSGHNNRMEELSTSWYEKELESFGDRVLLAKALRDSGVFNRSVEIFFNTAITNKLKWEQLGKSIVRGYSSGREPIRVSEDVGF